MGNPAREDNAIRQAAVDSELPQSLFLRPSADQKHAQARQLICQHRRRLEQQVETLVGIERAREADDDLALESQPGTKRGVGRVVDAECKRVDGIGNDGNPMAENAPGNDFLSQAFANGRHVIGPAHRKSLQRTGDAIAEAALARAAVIDSRVFPKGPHFVDHRNAAPASDPQRGQGVEHRRVGMNDVWFQGFAKLIDRARRCRHLPHIQRNGIVQQTTFWNRGSAKHDPLAFLAR